MDRRVIAKFAKMVAGEYILTERTVFKTINKKAKERIIWVHRPTGKEYVVVIGSVVNGYIEKYKFVPI